MREKNLDLMRQDIVSVLKNSSMAFVRELVGADPVAVFRWAILRAFFRGYFAFRSAGIKHRKERADQSLSKITTKARFRTGNDSLVRWVIDRMPLTLLAKRESYKTMVVVIRFLISLNKLFLCSPMRLNRQSSGDFIIGEFSHLSDCVSGHRCV